MQRHDTDVVSLVFGLLFLIVAAGWGMAQIDLIEAADLRLAFPLGLVAVGVAGLAASLRRSRRLADQPAAGGTTESAEHSYDRENDERD